MVPKESLKIQNLPEISKFIFLVMDHLLHLINLSVDFRGILELCLGFLLDLNLVEEAPLDLLHSLHLTFPLPKVILELLLGLYVLMLDVGQDLVITV